MEQLNESPKVYRTVCRVEIGGQIGNGECDVFFKDGKPFAVIHNYGNMAETTPLDPTLLKPSPVPHYSYVYQGVIHIEEPKRN